MVEFRRRRHRDRLHSVARAGSDRERPGRLGRARLLVAGERAGDVDALRVAGGVHGQRQHGAMLGIQRAADADGAGAAGERCARDAGSRCGGRDREAGCTSQRKSQCGHSAHQKRMASTALTTGRALRRHDCQSRPTGPASMVSTPDFQRCQAVACRAREDSHNVLKQHACRITYVFHFPPGALSTGLKP